MKKLLSILFMLIFVFCLVSCDSSNNKPDSDKDDEIIDNIEDEEKEEKEDPEPAEPTSKTYKVKFVDEDGNVLGIKRVSKNTTFKDPGYGIEGYDTIAWLYNGIPWDFENDIVESDIVLVLNARKHIHEFVNGECSCGFKSPYNIIPDLTESELKELTATVTFWHAFGMHHQVILDEIIFEFNKIYPNIVINHQSYGDYQTLRNCIVSSIAAGIQPTIAQVYPEHVSLYLEANGGNSYEGVRALDEFINHPTYGLSQAQLNDFIPSYLSQCKQFDQQGTQYSMPFVRNTELLFFNASWFEEHGLLEKYNLGVIQNINGVLTFVANENALLSWEDIEEIGKYYINSDEYKQSKSPLFSFDSESNMFITLTKQWGGQYSRLTGENQGEFLFNSPESKSAINWYYEGFKSGYFTMLRTLGLDYCSDAISYNKIKMFVGSASNNKYIDGKFVLGVLPVPQKENQLNNTAMLLGSDLSLFHSKTGEEELAGWLFIKFLTTWNDELETMKQPTYIWSTKGEYLPYLSSLYYSMEYQNYLSTNPEAALIHKAVWQQRNYSFCPVAFKGASNGKDFVENIFHDVLYNNYSVEDAYTKVINQLTQK